MNIKIFSLVTFFFCLSLIAFAQDTNQQKIKTDDKILLSFNNDFFSDETKSWQFASGEYQFKETFGSFIPRLNFANRFSNSEIQFEADAYIFLSTKTYFYLNAGLAEGKVFPRSRAGIELYQIIPFNIELSAGYRYLYFSPNNVNIYSGSVGYYFGDYWISIRPYFVNESGSKTKTSITITGRRYFVDSENYLTVRAGYGSYPASGNTQADFNRNDSKFFGVDYQFYILERTTLQIGFLLENEELNFNKSRSRYNFSIALQQIL